MSILQKSSYSLCLPSQLAYACFKGTPPCQKEGLRDLEPPSARKGFSVSFAAKEKWRQLKGNENGMEKEKQSKKMDGQKQRESAAKGGRNRIHRSKWPSLIQEYFYDTSKGKQVFARNHPEIKHPQQTISRWGQILEADVKKMAKNA